MSNITEEVRERINYLMKRLNADPDKKDKKEIRNELVGHGIIPLRVKSRSVSLLTDTGLYLENFKVDGKIETSMGTIIGYYCPSCLTASTVNDSYKLCRLEQQTQHMNCLLCNSYSVMPLFGNFVIPADK